MLEFTICRFGPPGGENDAVARGGDERLDDMPAYCSRW